MDSNEAQRSAEAALNAAHAKDVQEHQAARERLDNALKESSQRADEQLAKSQEHIEFVEANLATVEEALEKEQKSNAEVAAEVMIHLMEETQNLKSFRKQLEIEKFKLEKAKSSESEASRKIELSEAREAAIARGKERDDFYATLLEQLMKSKFNKDGMIQFRNWYVFNERSRPSTLPPPPGQLVYTEAQAQRFYEKDRLVRHYEAEVILDLKAVLIMKLEHKVKNAGRRTAFLKDETHGLNPVRFGRETAELIASVKAAEKTGRPEVDKRVLKSQSAPDWHARLTREDRKSLFWSKFEETAYKVGKAAGLKSESDEDEDEDEESDED